MQAIELTGIPSTVEQAVEALTEFYTESLPEIMELSEKQFTASAHYGAGMFIRNSWYLWWHEDHHYDHWPKEKPTLVKHLNDLGIIHLDDMSGILMTCFYRKVHNLAPDIEGQVEFYKDYWRKAGFADGIPKG